MPKKRHSFACKRMWHDGLGGYVTVVTKGSTLYTGQSSLPIRNLYAARTLRDALVYARRKKDGRIFVLRTTRDIILVKKKDVMWAMKEKRERELWEGAGAPDHDYPVAKALQRYTTPGKRAHGVDGWIHDIYSKVTGTGEVMLLDPESVTKVVRTREYR